MARLRIVTWNCGMALVRKASNLLALDPDIAVVQECSKKSVDVLHGHGLSGLWFGANPNKGLAVFCGTGFALQSVDKLFGKWVVPVRALGAMDFNLLAVWACPVGTKRADNYIGEVHRCLVKHRRWFGKAPVVAAGDFNSNVQWDANRPGRNHTEVVRLFDGHDLISAYHTHNEEKQGAETRPTYYFYRHKDKPFHIDYPLTAVGDINTYALFAELFAHLTNSRGRSGAILPTQIAITLSPVKYQIADPDVPEHGAEGAQESEPSGPTLDQTFGITNDGSATCETRRYRADDPVMPIPDYVLLQHFVSSCDEVYKGHGRFRHSQTPDGP